MNTFTLFLEVLLWLAGIAIAKGFWAVTLAIIPFYAWYLVVEQVLVKLNFLV